jgi:hypothetical protein
VVDADVDGEPGVPFVDRGGMLELEFSVMVLEGMVALDDKLTVAGGTVAEDSPGAVVAGAVVAGAVALCVGVVTVGISLDAGTVLMMLLKDWADVVEDSAVPAGGDGVLLWMVV